MRLLINCSNLHGGGSAAVAASFIYQITKCPPKDIEISLLLSNYVASDLQNLGACLDGFKSVVVKDYFGIKALWLGLSKHLKGYDVVFTVFGPAYILRFESYKHIVGFAQPSIIYPDRIGLFESSFIKRFFLRGKYFLQEIFFSKADVIVVELEHVKNALSVKSSFFNKEIFIVKSTVDSIYSDIERWRAVPELIERGSVKLGLISRNYAHKNLRILPEVKRTLLADYGMEVDFFVTFSAEEWELCSDDFKANIINVGRLELAQCPSFYTQLDGVVFPSLLECFSAVPLEAMIVGKPLFASNLDFIRDCCGPFAFYFDPMSASSIAHSIHEGFFGEKPDLESAKKHAMTFGGASRRSEGYLSIIKGSVVSKND